MQIVDYVNSRDLSHLAQGIKVGIKLKVDDNISLIE